MQAIIFTKNINIKTTKVTKTTKAIAAACIAVLSSTALADSTATVEKCTTTLGTISVVEPEQGYYHLSAYGLGSPAAILRMMIQQSACFDVVERSGAAFSSIQRERALGNDGDLQQDANVGKGQLQAADFVMTPNIQISANNTGGAGGVIAGLGGLFGKVGSAISSVAGKVKFKETQTSLLIADVRSGIQVASAEGTEKKTDFNIGAWGLGGGGFSGAGGYTNTPEGKMISASLLNNYNNIVLQIRDKPQLIKPRSIASAVNAAASIKATNRTHTTTPAPGVVTTPVIINTNTSAHSNSNISAIIARYTGTFSGTTQGSFALSIAADGKVVGSGNSAANYFAIKGFVDESGSLSMSTSGTKIGTSFSGFVDSNTGALKGIWTSGSKAKGTFSGNKM